MTILTKSFWIDRDPTRQSSNLLEYKLMLKQEVLNKPDVLSDYLQDLYNNVDPNFMGDHLEKASASQAKPLLIPYRFHSKHKLAKLAESVPYLGEGKNMHPMMQHYIMEHSRLVVASEIPLISDTHRCFIDYIFLTRTGQIIIADFKPNAIKEKPEKVMSQLWWDRECLSFQTGIPRKAIKCLYFDKFVVVEMKG